MLGSSHDGDDILQETLVRAWRARESLSSVAAVRPWLYRIATNACLDELRHRKHRPLPVDVVAPVTDPNAPPLPPGPEAAWLEPVPDAWMAGVTRDPGAAYEVKESVALAFVAAIQCLSARQRAVLLLRDVLGMPADETAAALDMTVASANSSLHRAREALRERVKPGEAKVDLTSETDDDLLRRYVRAWETLDIDAFVALLHDDIIASMPPSPTWFRGKADVATFARVRPFANLAAFEEFVLVPARANGQPALAFYCNGAIHSFHVMRFKGGRVVEFHHFCNEESFAAFELAPTLSPKD
jgi:RNA polymerase sigma-70 factor (ECF subfamily)